MHVKQIMVQKKGNVTGELYLRYIYTVSKVGYIYIKCNSCHVHNR